MGGAQVGHAGCQPMYICAVSFIATRSINRGMPWRKESTVLVVALYLLPIITAEGVQTFFKHPSNQPDDQFWHGGKFDHNAFPGNQLGDPGPGCIHVNTSTHRLVDGYHRERYFHGVNVVVKGPPWIPRQDKFDPYWSFVEEDMQLIKEWGLNAIRYGMMWPGVEPERGNYNQTYLDASIDLVNSASKYGIYTLLDAHQDVLSQKFCGEGIPDWAVDTGSALKFPEPLDTPFKNDPNTSHPSASDCAKHGWPNYQFADATGAAYQNLYRNKNGLRDSFAAFWAKVAQEFVGNPYIIGYELLNEPWAGNIYEDPLLLLPKIADRKNLAPFYEPINAEVRKYDQCHNLFFESITWDEGEVGFERVPGGDDYTNRSVLAWHFYIPPMFNTEITFPMREKDVERLKCGSFITEMGLGDQPVMDAADKYLLSWLAWDYKGYAVVTGSFNPLWNDKGILNMDLVKNISRTYAQAVAGVAMEMKYDAVSKDFTLQYHTTKVCTSNSTEIFLNEKLHYSSGYSVSLTPSDAGVEWSSPATNYVTVSHDLSLPERTVITVKITRDN